jgi:hypothetical protein
LNPVQQGILAALVVAAGMAVTPATVTPRFEDFPAMAVFARSTARPVLERVEEQFIRAKIEQGMKQARPNFASQYVVVEWDCGENCRTGAMVDAATGHVAPLPLPGRVLVARYDYRLRSNLIGVISNCVAASTERCDRNFYSWSNGGFHEVYRDSTR